MRKVSTMVCLAIVAVTASASLVAASVVEFRGRQIDLVPYVEGFPYKEFAAFYDAGKLYYFHDGDTRTLRELAFGGDLASGRRISDVDFSKRNVWSMRYNTAQKKLFWIGDEQNDEIINLYSLDPATAQLKKYTDVPYIFGYRWDESGQRVLYVPRLGHMEARLGEVRILDLSTGTETTIAKDNPEMRFTWTGPTWRPDGTGAAISAYADADRGRGNVVWVDIASGEWKVLTDVNTPRNRPDMLSTWLDENTFVYFSNEDGYKNAYTYNVDTWASSQLTRFKRDISDADVVELGGNRVLLAILESPIENEIVLVHPTTGEILGQQKVGLELKILDSRENRLLMSGSSSTSKFEIDEVTLAEDGAVSIEQLVGVPKDLQSRIVHSRVERVDFPTFDIDPATGKTRLLHAFLYYPNAPLPNDDAIVMIQSFYGGVNRYSTRNQILCEAGIYVLSPSPRGSSGFGREFSALNDKDLGGNEIIDVMYAARWVSKELGIPPERIGAFGGSHGGYATMRLLTFPGEVNGHKENFDWGFGISHAGFSDIIHFYENCNIPDWVTLEAGDPATEADKLRDRSPLYHASHCTGKLLLVHGTNDSRVPVEGSRAMADSLRKYHKDVTLVEFEEQGHSIKGVENTMRFYSAWFEFLEGVSSTSSTPAGSTP